MIENPKLPLHLTEHKESICVRDADGEPLQYFYFDEDDWRRDNLRTPARWEAYRDAKAVVVQWNEAGIPF